MKKMVVAVILSLVILVGAFQFSPQQADAHSYWQCGYATIGGGGVRYRMYDSIGGGHYVGYTQRTYSDWTYYVTWGCS